MKEVHRLRVLVVEDSPRLRETLADGLRSAGYAVDTAAEGRSGLASARAISYDAMVLDLMLPGLDGLEVLRALRSANATTPVLILSARDRVEHRVQGLRAGADDYLVKPFALEELLARVGALCRRCRGVAAPQVCIGGVTLDLSRRLFRAGANPIELPPREFAVLEYLFLNAGRVVSRAELEEHVYSSERPVWSNSVDSAIAAIRRRLVAHGVEGLVRTRRRMGYIVESGPVEASHHE